VPSVLGNVHEVAANTPGKPRVGSEEVNTYLADQWLSYIRINAGPEEPADDPSGKQSELQQIIEEFGAIPRSRGETRTDRE